jgi:hypothetical protein
LFGDVAGRLDELEGSHVWLESVVKRLNSCEDIVAVGRLKLSRRAVLVVRFSGRGKAEVVGD